MGHEVEITALEAVAHWFSEAKQAVILAGPELTFEAGIPDAGELQFNPDINSFREDDSVKEEYWAKIAGIYPKISAAEPTAAHGAIYELSILGEVDCVITQAVDGLLIKAGCEKVLQIYSSIHWAQCLNCWCRLHGGFHSTTTARGLTRARPELTLFPYGA
ncbi:Sir2 family NAD-dependent protein deacetylase [Candidatus Mycalebacterium sp.]